MNLNNLEKSLINSPDSNLSAILNIIFKRHVDSFLLSFRDFHLLPFLSHDAHAHKSAGAGGRGWLGLASSGSIPF